jgi:hypothetical protein
MVVDHFPHENGKKRGNISGPKKAILDSKKPALVRPTGLLGLIGQ